MISATTEEGGVVEDNTKVNINIEKMNVGDKLSANRPYIIVPNSNTYEFVVDNDVKLYAPDESSRLHLGTAEFYYDFYGTYDDFKATKALDWMSLKTSGSIVWNATSNAKLVSYNWYIKITSNNDNANYSKIDISFVEENSDSGIATYINSFEDEMDGIEGFYNASGVKREKPSKGLNIVKYKNGNIKKIYIK